MPSEIDINLIFLRLEKLEERIKVLEADVNNLKPDDYYQVKAQSFQIKNVPLEENSDNNPGPPRPFISTEDNLK